MRWQPENGHVPRGFCGATGRIDEVQLVLVVAEPGDPGFGESYSGNSIDEALEVSLSGIRNPTRPFHKNVRKIMDICFPGTALDEQLRRTWRTNAVLCSATVKCGPVPRTIEDTCVSSYLVRQLELFPNAMVAALGGKAHRRLSRAGIQSLPALHPTCRESDTAKFASWQAIARELRRRSASCGR